MAAHTAERVIRQAYREAGLLQEGQTPNSEQYAEGLGRLHDLINAWMVVDGLKLWTWVDTPVTLVAGTARYALGPAGTIITDRPTRVIQGYYLNSSGQSRPLEALSWDAYLRLGDRTQTGQITSFHVDKQATNLYVNFWLVPDADAATGTVHLLLPRQITNPAGLLDTLDFPQEWFMALLWGLADELTTGQPDSIVTRCAHKAASYYSALSGQDVEDAPLRFVPSPLSGVEGRFR